MSSLISLFEIVFLFSGNSSDPEYPEPLYSIVDYL